MGRFEPFKLSGGSCCCFPTHHCIFSVTPDFEAGRVADGLCFFS